ncbi:peptidoglycan glycosyltransferase [Deinococcus wulumuqiensis R12]|uniref:peptidoglycan glycosyltransferase n=2 Tax=Deinococcus wulumuqiensis TaxID=980427 RepID=A0AAV4K747_9DEIO|nr:transglycosylase domain-containing protein [Deinococcus wulumuqiensis]QII20923.1 peptidoglycan glycosyltransferase [Deinococcus wulumuqiensis R12]GGI88561.1 penicillin-binding protein [Deinococcus wulumuqiensis]GGP30413.1 penicillin-binding protein [Deinococcus wulumuqiensis]
MTRSPQGQPPAPTPTPVPVPPSPAPTSGQARGCGCLPTLILGVLLTIGLVFGGMWLLWGRDLPKVSDLDVINFSGQTRVFDRRGELIGTLSPSLASGTNVNRELLGPKQISSWLQKAVVASEDRRFYQHSGVDPIGVARGLLKGLLRNDLEGGSSITQQVVKNTLLRDLGGARTAERKFKEAVLAYQVDKRFNKDQILNAYLNVIYWGDGGPQDIIGAGGAARAYFKKEAWELNLAESVYLATIIPAPNRRYKDFKAYRPLMRSVLTRMVEDGQITKQQAEQAWITPIYPAGWRIGWNPDGTVRTAVLERPSRLAENLASMTPQGEQYRSLYYLQEVERELAGKVDRGTLYGGAKIFTGMDLQAQRAAEQASRNAQLPDGATLGIALVNPQNGEALALVGQKLTGGRPNEWNNATQSRRQVGSSIKPLLYTLALEKGWKQSDTILDSPISGDYQPKNYSGTWTGVYVSMRYALNHSLNLPTVRMAQEIGIPTFEAKLRDLGLTPPRDGGLSLSIGTLEASPLQLAAAYAPFANGGLYYAPSTVRRVESAQGEVLYQRPDPVGKRVWDKRVAWLGLDMIRGVVNDLSAYQGGLATKARIEGWQVGGKTGTTNDIKDLWFAGVTPLTSGAVWVGKQEGGAMPNWAYSGDIPTPVWQQATAGALAGREAATFVPPEGIVYRTYYRLNMAFRTEEADQAPVGHDGSKREAEPEAEPTPEPALPPPAQTEQAAPTSPDTTLPWTVPSTPEPSSSEPDPAEPLPSEPVPSDPPPSEIPPTETLPGDLPTDPALPTDAFPTDVQPDDAAPAEPAPSDPAQPETNPWLPPELTLPPRQ